MTTKEQPTWEAYPRASRLLYLHLWQALRWRWRSEHEPLGQLHPGDQVWAYNPNTKKMEMQPILHVWINHDNDLVDLTITPITKHDKAKKPSSEVIHTNQKHPFLTVEKGFVPVGQIKLGMHVVEANGQVGVVSGWRMVPGVKVMYNLEVAHDLKRR